MNRAPYSFTEAKKICKDYRQLTGSTFAAGTNAAIQSIAIAPYDDENKSRFIGFYFLLNDADQALLHASYKGLLFDVLVIACSDDQKLLHESLQCWIESKELPVGAPAEKTSAHAMV